MSSYSHETVETLLGSLTEAKDLAETRNLIAHNPLVLDIYATDDDDYSFKEKIMSLRNSEKHIKYGQLVEFADKSEELSTRLLSNAISVFRYIDDENA